MTPPLSLVSLGTIAATPCNETIHYSRRSVGSRRRRGVIIPLLSPCPETSSAATTRDQTAADTVGLGELTGRKKQHVCLSFPRSVVATVQSLED